MSEPEILHLDGIHVLVVDDNDDARDVLRHFLEHIGASVTTAQSANEALGVLAQVKAHIIVSDLSMPGLTGHDLIRQVRALPSEAKSQTPAIALTAFADRENEVRALASGFQSYMVKPVDPMAVAREIDRLYRESRTARETHLRRSDLDTNSQGTISAPSPA